MIIYSLTYFLNMLGYYANRKSKKQMTLIVFALLIFICGTRYYMGGSDVYVYEGTFNRAPSVGVVLRYLFTGVNNGVNTNYETGFILLCSVVKSFGFTYFGFILIYTVIFYTLMIKGLKEFVPDWAPFIAAFMYKIMFYNTFISIRQGLTVALFCFMLKYLRDRKWYIYFPLCYLALLEHSGAIILFPVYFVTYLPTSKKFIWKYSLAFLPTLLISSRIDISTWIIRLGSFLGRSEAKAEQWANAAEEISIIHTIECYVIVILILLFYEKIMSNPRKNEVKLALQLFLMAIPMFTLFKDWIVLTREKDYFVLMYGLLIGYILEGRTTAPFICEEGSYYIDPEPSGRTNFIIISLTFFVACYIGMMRYVLVFDWGALKHFVSFIFKKDATLFSWWGQQIW